MSQKTVIIQGESLGRGDEQLGRILMANFLRLLAESGKKPATIILWNAGIRLACEGSDVLEHLKRLEKQGVEILACTTCLEYFELRDKMLVGKPTTMSTSIQAMMETDVVTF